MIDPHLQRHLQLQYLDKSQRHWHIMATSGSSLLASIALSSNGLSVSPLAITEQKIYERTEEKEWVWYSHGLPRVSIDNELCFISTDNVNSVESVLRLEAYCNFKCNLRFSQNALSATRTRLKKYFYKQPRRNFILVSKRYANAVRMFSL